MHRILFIQPTQYGRDGKLCKQGRLYLPGLVFPLLSAMTPPDWEVAVRIEVIDGIDFEDTADIVGIGTMGFTIFRALEIAEEFKKRGKLVVLGGYMASIMVTEVSKYVDAVVVGDAETSYPRLLKDFEQTGCIQSVYSEPVDSLANIPLPHYEILTQKRIGTMLPVQAARGCPNSCSFCSIACLYKGRYMPRPVKEVARDIAEVKRLGFREFYLIDDNIIGNPAYFLSLCKTISKLKMKWSTQCSLLIADNPNLLAAACASGASMMSFGVESLNQEGLDKLNKAWLDVREHRRRINTISRSGILVSTEMIIGTDGDTLESIRATADFILECHVPIPRFYILTPMPGSPLFDEYKREGRLLTEDFSLYDGSMAVFKPVHMSAEELTEAYWELSRRVFSITSILARTLFNPLFFRNPSKHLFALIVNLHYRAYVKRKVPPNIF